MASVCLAFCCWDWRHGGGFIDGGCGRRRWEECVRVGVVKPVLTQYVHGQRNGTGGVGKREVAWEGEVFETNLCPLAEGGVGCKYGLRGDDCFDGSGAVAAHCSDSVAIVEGKLEQAPLCAWPAR